MTNLPYIPAIPLYYLVPSMAHDGVDLRGTYVTAETQTPIPSEMNTTPQELLSFIARYGQGR